ncbi:cytochrome b/b6 domain-containing protein [Alphaproteobacteria bacterium]|nr:cytochrome b/b6 domain-containing protein [Alphaproteobacteria bacterium]
MRVWDLPLRIFHWGFMVSVFGAIISAKADVLWVHERFGLLILALISFRIIWGFVGGHHARFRNFLVGPLRLLAWLRSAREDKTTRRAAGHSPLGGYSVLALLGVPLLMVSTGIVSTDGILFDGPLAHLVPDLSADAGKIHHDIGIFLLLLIILHLGAILFYKFKKKHNLTSAMVTGRASEARDQINGPEGSISTGKTIFGLVLMAGLIAAAQMIILLRPSFF